MNGAEMFKRGIHLTPDPEAFKRLCDCDGPITLNRVDGTLNTWACAECGRTVRLSLHGFEVTLRDQIANIIGDNHPDTDALIESIQRANHTPFDSAAGTLSLLKAGMPADVVLGGGLDAASRLCLSGAISTERAAELIATTVNTFGLGPQWLPVIPGYINRIRDLGGGA